MSYFKAEMHQIRCRPGLCPDAVGSLRRSPRPSRLPGRGYPLPTSNPSTSLASRSWRLRRRNQLIPCSTFPVIRPLEECLPLLNRLQCTKLYPICILFCTIT